MKDYLPTYDKREKFIERYFIKGSGALTIILLFLIITFMLKNGLPFLLNHSFLSLFDLTWSPLDKKYGIITLLYGSLLITMLALLWAIPISMSLAIFISEIVPKKLRNTLKVILELVAAIPSVVFGFIGIVMIAPFLEKTFQLHTGLNAFTASILLAFMTIPTITSIAEESINSVSKDLKEASYALGANKIQTVFLVSIPSAISGILAGIMLGFGRVIGETMTVMMVAGGTAQITGNIFAPIRTMTATIASEMGEVIHGDEHYQVLFLIGCFLFAITLLINMIIRKLTKRIIQKHKTI